MTTSSTGSDPGRARTKWPEWVGSWPRLQGRQTPEFESRFPGDESEGDRCAQFGARIGLRCMPWEWLTIRGILSLQPPNDWGEQLWTHRDCCIECTRQQGKTLIVVLLILWCLFRRGERIVYTAQRWSTASDVFDRVLTVIDRVPSLKRRLADKPSKAGNRGVIKLVNGAKCEFGPRSQDFGRGYTEVDRVIHDESYDVDPAQDANLTGAQSAALNPQTVYVSTPPVADVHPNSKVLAGLHRLGLAKAPDLYYALFAAPRDLERADPQAWQLAQPSYGIATNEREIRSKLQKAKTAAQRAIFDADYLGWGDYPPDESELQALIDADLWGSQRMTGPVELVGAAAVALHRAQDGVWLVASAQRTSEGRVHVELGPYELGSNLAVVDKVVQIVAAWDPVSVAMDSKGAAAALVPHLVGAGVEPTLTNTSEYALACGTILDDAQAGHLSHSGQQLLADAVASLAKRDLPGGGFAWEETTVTAPWKAVTLAHWALLQFGRQKTRKPRAAPVAITSIGRDSLELDVMSMAM